VASSRVVLPPLTALPPKQPSCQGHRDQTWREALDEIITVAARGQEICATGTSFYRLSAGSHIEQRCWARLAPGMARLKLAGFREQWRAERIVRTETRCVMEVRSSGSILQRCFGWVPAVIIDVCFGAPRENTASLTPIRISIHPTTSGRARTDQILTEMGPPLLNSLQTYLNTQAERDSQERYPCSQIVLVQVPATGQSLTAQLRDIGRDGLCLYATTPLPAGPVTLTLTRPGSSLTVQVPGWVRDNFADEGRYEVEVSIGG
jgi:hypothetical protein